jgi:carboxyl-terminal processing protease
MSNRVRTFRLLIIIIIAFLAGYYFGVNKVSFDWKNYKPEVTIISKDPPPGVSTIDFTQFWTVWQKLQTDYYDKSKLDPQKMLNGAISGMVQSLGDPFTLYLPPVQNTDFKQGLAGQFSGIGAELGTKVKDVVVISPLDGSPAEKAGIKAGDTILKVDGVSVTGMDLSSVVDKIRGPKGTQVKLLVNHKDTGKQEELTITRDVITVKSVDGWVKKVKDIDDFSSDKSNDAFVKILKDQNLSNSTVAYIRLSQFGDSTNKDWTALINQLDVKIKQSSNFKGVILDLRNNPGGYLTDAQFIAGEFLPFGATVVEEDDGTGNIKSLNVERNGLLTDDSLKLIVLINKGSASASEIVAGALRDDKKTELVGETSFGKGTIQQAEDLGNGSGLHVTIAKWLTPSGIWVNGTGLKPDVSIVLNPKEPSVDTQLEKAVQELLK